MVEGCGTFAWQNPSSGPQDVLPEDRVLREAQPIEEDPDSEDEQDS